MEDKNNNTNAIKAQCLFEEAKKKHDKFLKSVIILGSKSQKYEDIAELYTKSAKMYQLAKNNAAAGNAFVEAAQCYLQASFGKYNASTSYVNASHCYVKDKQYTNAVPIMIKAIEILSEDGKFSQAAKYEKEIAEMFEQLNDIPNAIKHYETSAEYYETEGSTVTSSSCLLKIAHLAADLEDYQKAINYFEKASDACSSSLAKYSNKDNYLKAGILYLCLGDPIAAKKAIDAWCLKLPEFCKSKEHLFLEQITQAYKDMDVEAFKEAVQELDNLLTLDGWKRSFLVKIIDSIQEKDDAEDLT